MKTHLFILWITCLGLLSCRSASPAPTTQLPALSACQEPGTIENNSIEETSRGYGYRFSIYLPPCYHSDSQAYPVVYLIPGLGGGPADWFNAGAAQIADDLILSQQLPPFLIVSTETTSSDPHAQVILNDLIPTVETHYRTLTDRPYRAVAGASQGGIGAYRLAFQNPAQFASVALFGSGLIQGEEAVFQTWLEAAAPHQRPRTFFNCGQQDPLMLARAQAMLALLETADFETTTLFTPGDHSFAYWSANLTAYFQWMAQSWP